MNQITIRGLPAEVEKAVKKESKKKGLSINKAIISLLEKVVGIEKGRERARVLYHEMDHLAGSWSVAEANEFDKYLEEHRRIDEDLWR